MTSRFSLIQSQFRSFEECSTEACPVDGGGFFRGYWFYINWAVDYPCLINAHINLQVAFIALAALEQWKHDIFASLHVILRLTQLPTLFPPSRPSKKHSISARISLPSPSRASEEWPREHWGQSVKCFTRRFLRSCLFALDGLQKKWRCSKSLLAFEPALQYLSLRNAKTWYLPESKLPCCVAIKELSQVNHYTHTNWKWETITSIEKPWSNRSKVSHVTMSLDILIMLRIHTVAHRGHATNILFSLLSRDNWKNIAR